MNITGYSGLPMASVRTRDKAAVAFTGNREKSAASQAQGGFSLGKATRLSALALAMLPLQPAAKGDAYELRGVTRGEVLSTVQQASAPVVITEQELPSGITAAEIQRLLVPYQQAGLKATVIFADPQRVFRDFPVVINRFDENGKFILLRPRVKENVALTDYARRMTARNPEARNSDVVIVLSQIPRLYSEFQTPENQIPLDKWQQMSPEEQRDYMAALRYQYTYVDLTLMGAVIPNENAAAKLPSDLDALRSSFNAETKSIGPRSASVRDSVERLAALIKKD